MNKPLQKNNGKATTGIRRPRWLNPALRFTPYAWAKLQWFCHHGDTEIGGFGITPGSDDQLLLIEDFVTVKQDVTVASVSFDDEAVADFFDQQVDLGRRPEQFARIWLHTHPGDCPNPSSTDEITFQRVFGRCDWAVMFILAQGGETYARLRFNTGPGGACLLPVHLDYNQDFPAADRDAWEAEYRANIHPESVVATHFDLNELEIDERWLNGFGFDNLDEAEWQAMTQDPELYEALFEQEDEVIE